MDHCEFPLTPSQQDDLRQMFSGLSVPGHATEEQLTVAMPLIEVSQNLTSVRIREMLAR